MYKIEIFKQFYINKRQSRYCTIQFSVSRQLMQSEYNIYKKKVVEIQIFWFLDFFQLFPKNSQEPFI